MLYDASVKLLCSRAAILFVLLSFGVATVGCYWLSSRYDPMIIYESTASSHFDADIPRVFRNMTERSSDHYRTKVHPIFSLAAYAPVKLISGVLGIGDREAVNAMQALVAGLWAAGLSVLLLLILPGLVDAILFTGLAMLSAASLVFLTVPETYGWGSLSIVIALVVTALSERALSRSRLPTGWWGSSHPSRRSHGGAQRRCPPMPSSSSPWPGQSKSCSCSGLQSSSWAIGRS